MTRDLSCENSPVANNLRSLFSLSLGKGSNNACHLSACLFSKSVKKLNIFETIAALLKIKGRGSKVSDKGREETVHVCRVSHGCISTVSLKIHSKPQCYFGSKR